MGRVRGYIQVNGKKCWTLFDTGARNTYVVPSVGALLNTTKLGKPFRSALGGGVKKATIGGLSDRPSGGAQAVHQRDGHQ